MSAKKRARKSSRAGNAQPRQASHPEPLPSGEGSRPAEPDAGSPDGVQSCNATRAAAPSADQPKPEPAGDIPSDDPADPASNTATQRPFPIVGIGASAGGLEALQELFSQMPIDAGIAYVVVTHMHREHTSMLPELLGRATAMTVVEAAHGQEVVRDHVYVAPPGDGLTIQSGVLLRTRLHSVVKHPIDAFLRGLAADQGDRALCIILSGMGTDGTLGLRAIKAGAGMAMVQTPQSAKFAGMPSSALESGLVDYLLAPRDMPQQIVDYVEALRRRPHVAAEQAPEFPEESLREILAALRVRTGHDFSSYKRSTIRRRIERRMNVHRIDSPDDYARYLRKNKHEGAILFRELLITVTNFFRDPEGFDALAAGLRELLRKRIDGDRLRVWVPGCATGEEAYSVAIVLREALANLDRTFDVSMFATDLDPRAIETARAGIYPSGIVADVSEQRLDRFFIRDDANYRISKDIREMIVFAPQNVLSDPPFTRLDLIVCRNLLIYFDAVEQRRLLPHFHYALRSGGLLFLGPSETIGDLDGLFSMVDRKWKIYRRKEGEARVTARVLEASPRRQPGTPDRDPESESGRRPLSTLGVGALINRLLLSRFAPVCLVVDQSGDIVHIHGRSGLYLEPAEGVPRQNVLAMAREGLGNPLATAMRRAVGQESKVSRRGVSVKTNGTHVRVDIEVAPIEAPRGLRGLFLITLRPTATPPPTHPPSDPPADPPSDPPTAPPRSVTETERELQHTRESLQSTVEELESSNEELKSANEELQSMNEELQSMNEELETSKEEMQSLNEELNTVNSELNSKLEELSHANDDMQNLLNGIDVASVFLDKALRIKRFTEQARGLISLRPSDVGRPLADFVLHVEHPELMEDCRHVLTTLERREQEVRSRDGSWLMMRILPYRTVENTIDGVVVTFVSLDALKTMESSMRHFKGIVQTVRQPLLVLEDATTIRFANQAFYRTFLHEPASVDGQRLDTLGDGEWKLPQLRKLLERILTHDAGFNDFEVEQEFPRLGRRRFLLNARRIAGGVGRPDLILLAIEDATKGRS